MGGNQAMQDVAVALPLLEKLATKSQDTHRRTLNEITQACEDYEKEMIPRGFTWVQKSGGSTVVVSPKGPVVTARPYNTLVDD